MKFWHCTVHCTYADKRVLKPRFLLAAKDMDAAAAAALEAAQNTAVFGAKLLAVDLHKMHTITLPYEFVEAAKGESNGD